MALRARVWNHRRLGRDGLGIFIISKYLTLGYIMPFWTGVLLESLRQMFQEKQVSRHLGICYDTQTISIRLVPGES